MYKRLSTALLAVCITLLGVVSINFAFTNTAGAQGAVGSGGTGGGGTNPGYGWTTYTHGWAVYNIANTTGPSGAGRFGPTDGFRSGTWTNTAGTGIRDRCRAVGAGSVAIYIIGTGTAPGTSGYPNATGRFMGYNDRGYSGMWGGDGTSKDNGRASSISRTTAINRYQSLIDDGLISASAASTYSFANENVGWYCWNLPRDAVLDVQKNANGSILVGNSFTFNLSIRAYDRLNVGNATFDWRLDYLTNGGTWNNGVASGSNRSISGTNPRVNRTPTITPSSPGTYCYRLNISGKPSWARYNDQSQTQCVVVNGPTNVSPSITANATSVNRGNPANFTLRRTVTNYSAPSKQVPYTVQYRYSNASTAPWLSIPGGAPVTTGTGYSASGLQLTVSGNTTAAAFTPVLGFNTSQIPPTATIICVRLVLNAGAGYTVSGSPASRCVNITDTPPVSPTVTVAPNTYEKGVGGTVQMIGTLNCGTSIGNITWRLDGPGLGWPVAGPAIHDCSISSTATLTATITGASLDPRDVGDYDYTATITSPLPAVTSAPAALNVYEVPYANFVGHDIYAGCGQTVSAVGKEGRIIFNVHPTDPNSGAAVQYAAIALNGFNSTTSPSPAPSLNITTASGLSLGADYLRANWLSTSVPVCPDIVSLLPATGLPFTDGPVPVVSGYYTKNGNIEIDGGTASGKSIISALAGGNIYISSGTSVSGVFPTLAEHPTLLIYADGDIYIDHNVTSLDAILVAKGTIYTCAKAPGVVVTAAERTDPAYCRNTLTINGALSASNVQFERSIGTRRIPGVPAEQVNFPAYLNFTSPFPGSATNTKYQSLFNAPPYL